MSNNRLPPLRSNSPDDNEGTLDTPTLSSTNVVKTRKKKRTADNNEIDEVPDSEGANTRPRRRQRAPHVMSPDNPVTDESGAEAASPRVKPVRKKRKPQVNDNIGEMVSDVAEPNTNVNNATAKKKRKNKTRPENAIFNGGLASELTDLGDDIVDTATEITIVEDTTAPPVAVMRSEPTQKVYLEKSNGFKATDRNKLTQKRALAADASTKKTGDAVPVNTVQFALSTHRVFKTIALFLQGTFAGIALWQIVSSSLLIVSGSVAFSLYYMPLSIPVQSLYFFLFAVACVAVLDRYDLASTTRRLLIQSVSFQAGTVCVLIYFCGLIISLGTAPFDEGIGLNQTAYLTNQTLSSSCQWLCQWQILNITRGVLAILGWLVVSLRPGTDRLTKSLLQANDDILLPNMNNRRNTENVKTTGSDLWNTQTNNA